MEAPANITERMDQFQSLLGDLADVNDAGFYSKLAELLNGIATHIRHDSNKSLPLNNVAVVLNGASREIERIGRKAVKQL